MPYTYLIGWSDRDLWYYGCRYSADCNPSDLWKTYFTSSIYVKEMIEQYGDPDVIQIRRKFDDRMKCRIWESKVLRRMNAARDVRWLNRHDGSEKFIPPITVSEKTRRKISKSSKGQKRPNRTKEHCMNISRAKKGMKFTEEQRKKMSEIRSGKGNPNYGKKTSDETKQKIREGQKKRPFFVGDKRFEYLRDAMEEFKLNSIQAVKHRLDSRSYKYTEWYYEDTGFLEAIRVKRPDLAERNRARKKN